MIDIKKIKTHQIAQNGMNDALTTLYQTIISDIAATIIDLNRNRAEKFISNPYLLACSNEYATSLKRIMCFGQETNCWGGELNGGIFSPDNTVKDLQSIYNIFANQGKGYHSPFWNDINRYAGIAHSNNATIIANNLAKIGYMDCTGHNPEINVLFAKIIKAEIRICKPDLIIFQTGPKYDDLLSQILGTFTQKQCINNLDIRKCSELKFTDNPALPGIRIYRTYHPAFLIRSKNRFAWINEIYSFLEQLIISL